MKLDELTQNKKNLCIVIGAVAVLLIITVVFLVKGKGSSETAQAPGMMGKGGAPGMGPGMGPGMMGGPGMSGPPGMMGKGGPGMGGPGMGGPGMGGAPGMMGGAPGMMGGPGAGAAAPAASEPGEGAALAPASGEGDGTSIPKGAPVEPYRADPFVPTRRPQVAALPRPVLPPIVVVNDAPQPLLVPPTVNVIPTSVVAKGSDEIAADIKRRMSGVLWNGRVYAILETAGKEKQEIVRPGDQIDENLWVRSISRDEMVLVRLDGTKREEIAVSLKESDTARPAGLGPGMGGPKAGMPGPGMMPGMMPKGG